MADKKKARRLPTNFSAMGNNGLFSAGMTMSPVAWDLQPVGSRGQQTAFNFDEQSTHQWRHHQDDDGGISKDGVHRSLDKSSVRRTNNGKKNTKKKVNAVDDDLKKSTSDDSVESNIYIYFMLDALLGNSNFLNYSQASKRYTVPRQNNTTTPQFDYILMSYVIASVNQCHLVITSCECLSVCVPQIQENYNVNTLEKWCLRHSI